jgi:hypothetical protein
MRVIYPFAGLTLTSNQVNLVNPYRFELLPGAVATNHGANGIGFSGISDQEMSTQFNPVEQYGSTHSNHLALYVTRADDSTV